MYVLFSFRKRNIHDISCLKPTLTKYNENRDQFSTWVFFRFPCFDRSHHPCCFCHNFGQLGLNHARLTVKFDWTQHRTCWCARMQKKNCVTEITLVLLLHFYERVSITTCLPPFSPVYIRFTRICHFRICRTVVLSTFFFYT